VISVEVKLTTCDDMSRSLGRLDVKTTRETEAHGILGDKEAFLRLCEQAWAQYHGERA
jgi:hypothetical protein